MSLAAYQQTKTCTRRDVGRIAQREPKSNDIRALLAGDSSLVSDQCIQPPPCSRGLASFGQRSTPGEQRPTHPPTLQSISNSLCQPGANAVLRSPTPAVREEPRCRTHLTAKASVSQHRNANQDMRRSHREELSKLQSKCLTHGSRPMPRLECLPSGRVTLPS